MSNKGLELRLFVYGTLKRGFRNHRHFCQGVVLVEEGWLRGRLYQLPPGYPGLLIPEQDVVAEGTADPLRDAAMDEHILPEIRRERSAEGHAEGGQWSPVWGEILVFGDPARRLPSIDRLEDFRPDLPSIYRRVLARVHRNPPASPIAAWVYVMARPDPGARLLLNGRWSGKQLQSESGSVS